MTIYKFHALDKEGNTLDTAEVDTIEAAQSGMLALGYTYFPKVMKDAEKLVLQYPQDLRELRADNKFFDDIVLDVKSAKLTVNILLRLIKEDDKDKAEKLKELIEEE